MLQGRPDAKLAKSGKKVAVRYVGKLKSNGKIFDQTKGAATFSFRVGVGEVIKGAVGWGGGGDRRGAALRTGCRLGWWQWVAGESVLCCPILLPHLVHAPAAGWDRGVEGMRVGDKRRLTIPSQMAYGTTGVKGTIPGNATLMFDVELVDVK